MPDNSNKYNKYGGIILLLSVLFLGSACDTIGYYTQAVGGHLSLLSGRKPIDTVIEDEGASPELKQRLNDVKSIRYFAYEHLKIDVGGSYSKYVELDRPYVAWTVFAAPEFSLELKEWCFPIVGCMKYIGYFSKDAAEKHGEKLRKEGYDVLVTGAIAYSTLGWFDDPIVSSFIDRSRPKLGFLLFHELGHQVVYLKGDTEFNESFANTVAIEGTRRWLTYLNDGQALADFETAFERQKEFVELIEKYRKELKALYEQDLIPETMDFEKKAVYRKMTEDYQAMKKEWGGYSGYDDFFEDQFNNAKLGSVSAYFDLVPAFRKLLKQNGGDMEAFYEACRRLGEKSKSERHAYLEKMVNGK
jgi:predicted aminopeptidase